MEVVLRAAGALACLALAACGECSGARPKASSDSPGREMMPAADVRAALDFVVEKVRNVHPDTVHGLGDESEKALLEALAIASEPIPAERLSFVLNEWVASLHDAHAVVRHQESGDAIADCVDLPLSWRPQGLIVTRDTGSLGRGDRILSIGGHDESSLLHEFRKIVPVENDYRLKYLGAMHLQRGDVLRHLDLVEGDRVTVVAETRNGGRRELGLPVASCDRTASNLPWVGFEFHERYALGTFWFDRFEYNQEMVDTMESFFIQADERGIDKVAVDLRGKTGGDSTVAFAFLEHFADISYRSFSVEVRISDELSEMSPAFDSAMVSPLLVEAGLPPIEKGAVSYVLPGPLVRAVVAGRMNLKSPDEMHRVRGKRIYMLTDAGTFSSGNLFAILLRDNHIGTLVGEPTGNRINFNGSELRFDIPGTGLYLNLSTAKMLRPDAGRGDAPAIEPDVIIVTSRDDIATGRDPQLEYLKEL
jgi:C-terminal processing protease CtpA/Prc